jgi:hypothetical protein
MGFGKRYACSVAGLYGSARLRPRPWCTRCGEEAMQCVADTAGCCSHLMVIMSESRHHFRRILPLLDNHALPVTQTTAGRRNSAEGSVHVPIDNPAADCLRAVMRLLSTIIPLPPAVTRQANHPIRLAGIRSTNSTAKTTGTQTPAPWHAHYGCTYALGKAPTRQESLGVGFHNLLMARVAELTCQYTRGRSQQHAPWRLHRS